MRPEFVCVLAGVTLGVGCGSASGKPDAPNGVPGDGAPGDGPGHTPGMPGLGAYALNHYGVGESSAPSISTPPQTTASMGSTIVVGIGRGNKMLFTQPTDNKGNTPYLLQGNIQPYVHPNEDSGTALYALTSAKGGSGFAVSTTTGKSLGGNSDEVTIAAVEVIDGTRIQAFAWNEVVQDSSKPPASVTSLNVTTTGPATLIAFWWGDLTATVEQTAVANNGFQVVASVLLPGSVLQGAVAVKNTTDAGTYNVTWTATPLQGAQLWLVAVQ